MSNSYQGEPEWSDNMAKVEKVKPNSTAIYLKNAMVRVAELEAENKLLATFARAAHELERDYSAAKTFYDARDALEKHGFHFRYYDDDTPS